MQEHFFFGYGSLVNRATHDYANAHTARLSGWRRVWCHTDLRPVAFLSVVPDATTTISGLMAEVPGADWAALDAREYAYDRITCSDTVSHPATGTPNIAVYSVPERARAQPTQTHPILQSYLDVVVQGYLREFGADGAQAFFDTTDGWNAPILQDRNAPRYPRHQTLSVSDRQFIDAALDRLGVQRLPINPLP